jgi:uncharacterized protein YhaN
LQTELVHAGSERTVDAIEVELEEARTFLRHEEIQQKARQLLQQRLQEKIREMATDVPRGLAEKISKHLGRLTRGAYTEVRLSEELNISGVTDNGPGRQPWAPNQLSHGERNQVALAVKIAVARALAEMSGPVFLILDDSLVSFDPSRRAETEAMLLELVADGNLQIILLTCHSDWVADWKRRAGGTFHHIELEKVAEYYCPPLGINHDAAESAKQ